MKLRAITKEEIEIVRQWRNEDLSYLRTPFLLTQEMQEEFYGSSLFDLRRFSSCVITLKFHGTCRPQTTSDISGTL